MALAGRGLQPRGRGRAAGRARGRFSASLATLHGLSTPHHSPFPHCLLAACLGALLCSVVSPVREACLTDETTNSQRQEPCLCQPRSRCPVDLAGLYRIRVSESGPASRRSWLWKGAQKPWFTRSRSRRDTALPSFSGEGWRKRDHRSFSYSLCSRANPAENDRGLRGGCLWLAMTLGGWGRVSWARQPALSA